MPVDNPASTRRKPLHRMFSAIPSKYDLVNTIVTCNLDKRWRRRAAQRCLKGDPARILDLCCGTGDLAITVARSASYSPEIKGLDFSQEMLDIAEKKAAVLPRNQIISFVQGDASRMPFPDEYFDCIGIAFGFRNLTYKNPLIQAHLAEILRVLKTGGTFVIVESSQPRSKFIRAFFRVYLRCFVYPVGALLSGNKSAYHYLAESVAHYYNPDELKTVLLKARFKDVNYQALFLGASGLSVVIK